MPVIKYRGKTIKFPYTDAGIAYARRLYEITKNNGGKLIERNQKKQENKY